MPREMKISPERRIGLERIASSPMAMRLEALEVLMARIVAMEEFDEPPPLAATIVERAPTASEEAKAPRLPKAKGAVAVIPVYGTVAQHRGSDYWGGVFTEEIVGLIAKTIDMPNVGAIVLSFDSPGGIVFGVSEAARSIREMSQAKPVYGHVKAESASASYWLSAATTKLFASPSAQAGSIGVWCAHVNAEKFYEQFGLEVTLVSAGKYKTENHPFGPITEDGKAEMQRSVDAYYEEFLQGVADGRNVSKATVKSDFGEGRMLSADRAKAAGMIDGIATMDELLAGIMVPAETGKSRSRAYGIAIAEAWSPTVDA